MANKKTFAGVLFVDITDSTGLYARFGDEEARRIILQTLGLLEQRVAAWGGEVIDRIGDELMCRFSAPDDAVRAAADLHWRVRHAVEAGTLPDPLTVRIGLHYGPVIIKDKRVFGDTVHTAKRMVDVAKSEQIITTGETLETLARPSIVPTYPVDRIRLKGKSADIDVREIIWDASSATARPIQSRFCIPTCSTRLELEYRDRRMTLDPSHQTASLGRCRHADFVLDQQHVSRVHAQIEFRRGRFVLIDKSANGTLIIPDRGEPVRVHRGESELPEAGRIAPAGGPAEARDSVTIVFRIEESEDAVRG